MEHKRQRILRHATSYELVRPYSRHIALEIYMAELPPEVLVIIAQYAHLMWVKTSFNVSLPAYADDFITSDEERWVGRAALVKIVFAHL